MQGWFDVREWLKVPKDGSKPKLIFFSNCVNLIKTFPLLLHDEKNPDDVAREPHEVTHAGDAVRYFVSGQPLAAVSENNKQYDYDEEDSFNDYNGF